MEDSSTPGLLPTPESAEAAMDDDSVSSRKRPCAPYQQNKILILEENVNLMGTSITQLQNNVCDIFKELTDFKKNIEEAFQNMSTLITSMSNHSSVLAPHQAVPSERSPTTSTQTKDSGSSNKKKKEKKKKLKNTIDNTNKNSVSNNYVGQNRFATLDEEDVNIDTSSIISDNTNNSGTNNLKTNNNNSQESVSEPIITVPYRTTPIIAFNANLKNLHSLLKEKNTLNYKVNYSHKTQRSTILPSDLDTYNNISEILKDREVNHFSYTPKHLKGVSLIIKGISKDFSPADLWSDFTSLGYFTNIHDISLLKGRLENFNFFLLKLKPGVSPNDFHKIKFLCHSRVSIEKFSRTDLLQCFRCQQIGHGSAYCNMSPKCVKCAGDHLSQNCELNSNVTKEKLKCSLCNQFGHPSSYRGCNVFKDVIARAKEAKYKTSKAVPVEDKIPFSSFPKPHQPQQDFGSLLEKACMESFGCNYELLKSIHSAFINTYKSTNDINKKREALLNFILSTLHG